MDVEPTEDKPLDPSHASFPAHPPIETAEVPPPPRQDVLPKATGVGLSLMKPASTLPQARADRKYKRVFGVLSE